MNLKFLIFFGFLLLAHSYHRHIFDFMHVFTEVLDCIKVCFSLEFMHVICHIRVKLLVIFQKLISLIPVLISLNILFDFYLLLTYCASWCMKTSRSSILSTMMSFIEFTSTGIHCTHWRISPSLIKVICITILIITQGLIILTEFIEIILNLLDINVFHLRVWSLCLRTWSKFERL